MAHAASPSRPSRGRLQPSPHSPLAIVLQQHLPIFDCMQEGTRLTFPSPLRDDSAFSPVEVNLGRSPSSSRTDVYLPPPRPEPQPPAGLPAQQSHPQSAKRSMADIDLEPEVDVPSASIPVPSLPNNELARKSPPRREKDMLAAIPPNSAGKRPRPSPSSDFKAFLSAMSTSDRRGIFLFADFR